MGGENFKIRQVLDAKRGGRGVCKGERGVCHEERRQSKMEMGVSGEKENKQDSQIQRVPKSMKLERQLKYL